MSYVQISEKGDSPTGQSESSHSSFFVGEKKVIAFRRARRAGLKTRTRYLTIEWEHNNGQ